MAGGADDIDLQWNALTTCSLRAGTVQASDIPDSTLDWTGDEEPWPTAYANEDEGNANATPESELIQDQATIAAPSVTIMGNNHSASTATHPVQADLRSDIVLELIAVDEMDADTTPTSEETKPTDYSGDSDELFEEYATKYELRPQTSKAGFISTWIDQDDTGNYDPNEEFRRSRPQRNRVKLREREYALLDSSDEDTVRREPAPKLCTSLVLELEFTSKAGKVAFCKHVKNLPAKAKPERDDFSVGYRLRKKPCTGTSPNGSGHHLDRPADGSGVLQDLTGHPIARGCWECLGLGLRCPLLDDERAWPCDTCVEDDHDCDLVTPPARKRTCERCKRKRITCSYAYSINHSKPCEDCEKDGFRCVAGPQKENIRPRIRYNRDWVNDPIPAKKAEKPSKTYWTCLQCKEDGRTCSFTNGASGEDCTACEMAGNICIPEQVVTPQHRRAPPRSMMAPKKRAAREPVEQNTPTKQQKKTKESPGATKMITTKFCHPIAFNHEDADGTKPCNFCEHYSFAILGLNPKEVEVIDWADGRGYTEISGGHLEGGVAPTRMCMTCTMQRFPVIMCQKHELRPIPGLSLDAIDVNDAITALFSDESRKEERWCSVCPSLATYECETAGSMDALGNAVDGCGLSLCENCMLGLTGVYDGDLQQMLAELKDESSDERPLGLRADFELLKQEGLLVRYVLWNTQQ